MESQTIELRDVLVDIYTLGYNSYPRDMDYEDRENLKGSWTRQKVGNHFKLYRLNEQLAAHAIFIAGWHAAAHEHSLWIHENSNRLEAAYKDGKFTRYVEKQSN